MPAVARDLTLDWAGNEFTRLVDRFGVDQQNRGAVPPAHCAPRAIERGARGLHGRVDVGSVGAVHARDNLGAGRVFHRDQPIRARLRP